MEFSWPVFLVMLLLGVVQLAVGVVLGRCLPLCGRKKLSAGYGQPEAAALDPHRLQFFANRLCKLVAGVSDEVGDHRNQITEVSRELASAQQGDAGTLTDSVLRSVARIVAINERLQGRLESAEQRLQQQNEQIEAHFTESRTDPLTGLMNRRAFDDALRFQVEQGARPFALMMIDVDYFKRLNDEYGHPAGDQVLCGISHRLDNLLAGSGMVARYGGEEFAVLVPAVDAVESQRIAERLRLAVATFPFEYEQVQLPLSVSLGVTLVAQRDDPFIAFKRADEALYTAKGLGRNCACFHEGESCRRIELDVQSSEVSVPAGAAGVSTPPRVGMPNPQGLTVSDNLKTISADLQRRMDELASPRSPTSR